MAEENDDAIIHLRVTKKVKGRWVRISRARYMKLSDFMVEAVEEYIKKLACGVRIPERLKFSDLKLARDADGAVSFDLSVIKKICDASELPIEMFTETSEDNVSLLIVSWYFHHIQKGGEPDPVAEDLLAEVQAEDKIGQLASFKPGRA